MARTRTTADHLNKAANLFQEALEELKKVDLRTYRHRDEEREAIQEARSAAESGFAWTTDAIDGATVLDLRAADVAVG